MTRYSPTIRRRRLSAELRRARTEAGMTLDDAARTSGITRTTLSNIESGVKKRPTVAEIRALLDTYGVTDEARRGRVLDLCRQAAERDWRASYLDVAPGEHVAFEAEASEISNWEPLLVPGLLQTPDYVRLLAESVGAAAHSAERVVESRVLRQRILDDTNPPYLWAIFDETALLRLGEYSDVLRGQIEHLLSMADRPRVTIQMTVADRLNPGSGGPFVIHHFLEPTDPTVVHVEATSEGVYLEKPEGVMYYRSLFNRLRLAALRPEETVDRLRQLIE